MCLKKLPTASTPEMHHEVLKLANNWRQPTKFLEMIDDASKVEPI